MPLALTGARVFDGAHILEGRAVVIGNGRILAVPQERDLGADVERRRIEGLLAPGFVDVQVNGGGGVLFNDVRNVDGLRTLADAHRAYGTTGLLPTFITDTRERMAEAMDAMRDALAARVPGVLGIHVEGPLHQPRAQGRAQPRLHAPDGGGGHRILTSLKEGRTLVTLAPERTGMDAVARLSSAGVLVCAGHTAGDYATIMEACRHGLRGFTHLYNAMPPLAGRDPGPVGAALDSQGTWCGLIVDGHHVSDAALRIAIAAKGPERMMLVTDAMSVTARISRASTCMAERSTARTAGSRRGRNPRGLRSRYGKRRAQQRAEARVSPCRRAADGIACSGHLPQLDHDWAASHPGYRADLVLLDESLHVRQTWIDGQSS
jgi:N-acetylglucosamine-6-phosphate deacetylase